MLENLLSSKVREHTALKSKQFSNKCSQRILVEVIAIVNYEYEIVLVFNCNKRQHHMLKKQNSIIAETIR